jgi:ABC-type sulfate transport system permease component
VSLFAFLLLLLLVALLLLLVALLLLLLFLLSVLSLGNWLFEKKALSKEVIHPLWGPFYSSFFFLFAFSSFFSSSSSFVVSNHKRTNKRRVTIKKELPTRKAKKPPNLYKNMYMKEI